MNKDFWKGKKVLITGHTGFKGSWLSLWLQKVGASVVGYSLAPPTKPSMFEIANVNLGITSICGDIRNREELFKVIKEQRPEIIFHLAAQPLVNKSYTDPIDTFSTNVMGTVNLLDTVRYCESVNVIVNITSDKCYDNKEWIWGYRENDPMGGRDPYSCSKGCAELVTSAFRSSFFSANSLSDRNVAIATARAGNVIGGGDWADDRLIPDVIRSGLYNKPLFIRNPYAIRPWQHVLDPLNGYILLAEKLWVEGKEYSEGWNFGPSDNESKTVLSVIQNILEIWQKDITLNFDEKTAFSEAKFLRLDSTKARQKLGWKSTLSLEDAIKWVISWFDAFEKGLDMRSITLEQIDKYERLLKE